VDNIIFAIKCLFVYVLILVPQLRLAGYKYDPHIGNFTASRVSGNSFKSIFFLHSFGVPIPILSLSVQYDYFGSELSKYKIFHAILVAATGPLFYVFSNILIKNELAAFIATILYAVSFNFPITGNWLIKSEHYENILFLAGGSILLSANNNQWLLVVASLILGCCLLCKFPALISFWLVFVVLVKQYSVGGYMDMSLVLTAYLAPFVVYTVVGQIVFRHHPKNGKHGSVLHTNIIDIIKNVPSTYLYFYKRDRSGYVSEHLKYHLVEYIKQFLPIIVLALLFLLYGASTEKWVTVLGFGIVSLIFIIRMSFSHVYSFNIVLCIAAGSAVVELPKNSSLVLIFGVFITAVYSFFVIRRDPTTSVYSKKQASFTIHDVLAEYIRKTFEPDHSLFVNINRSVAFIYPLSGLSLPCHISLLTIGGYGPYIDHMHVPSIVASAGRDLVRNFSARPPDYLVQSCIDWPIVNLSALEQYCGLSYRVVAVPSPFVVYRLVERRDVSAVQPDIDMSFLFNSDFGKTAMLVAAGEFIQQGSGPKTEKAVPETAEYERYKREYLLSCKKKMMLDHAMNNSMAEVEYFAKLFFYFHNDSAFMEELRQHEELHGTLAELFNYFLKMLPQEVTVTAGSDFLRLESLLERLEPFQKIRLRVPIQSLHGLLSSNLSAGIKACLEVDILLDGVPVASEVQAVFASGYQGVSFSIELSSASPQLIAERCGSVAAAITSSGGVPQIRLIADCQKPDVVAIANCLRPIDFEPEIYIACSCPALMPISQETADTLRRALAIDGNEHEHQYVCDPRLSLTVMSDGRVALCNNPAVPSFGSVLDGDILDIWNDHLFQRFRWELMVGLLVDHCACCPKMKYCGTEAAGEDLHA
jgi:hypothetical protein